MNYFFSSRSESEEKVLIYVFTIHANNTVFEFLYAFLTGDLLVTLARKSDSGQYICEVINEEGVDIASSNVLVKGEVIRHFCISTRERRIKSFCCFVIIVAAP